MCPFARNMRSSSPPSVADESSVRRHIIKNSVDPKFRYGVSELKMLHAVRELCGGQVPSARVGDQLPPEAAPVPEAVPFPVVDMLMPTRPPTIEEFHDMGDEDDYRYEIEDYAVYEEKLIGKRTLNQITRKLVFDSWDELYDFLKIGPHHPLAHVLLFMTRQHRITVSDVKAAAKHPSEFGAAYLRVQAARSTEKNATHACLATAHFWAPPSVAM